MVCDEFLFGDRQLNGTVSGLETNDYSIISASVGSTTAGFGFLDWSITDLPSAATDLVATRIPGVPNGTADRVIVRRGVMPSLGTAPIATLNFAGSEAIAPQSATLTLAGGGTDFIDISNSFVTANGTFHEMSYAGSTESSFSFLSVPASLRIDTDIHELMVSASNDGGWREIADYFKSPSNKTLTFGPMVGAPTISTVASSPVKRMKALIASQAEVGRLSSAERQRTERRFSARRGPRRRPACREWLDWARTIDYVPAAAPLPHLVESTLSEERTMAESVYKVIELIGTSPESWEKAAGAAVKRAAKTLRDLRIAEVKQLDMVITDGKIEAYRAKLSVSFKYEGK